MCVLLGGNRLDGGLHGAPREYDALHAQVGIESLLCSLLLFFVILLFVIGHQALVVFIAAVICYHVFCQVEICPCCVQCCCYLSNRQYGVHPELLFALYPYPIVQFCGWN